MMKTLIFFGSTLCLLLLPVPCQPALTAYDCTKNNKTYGVSMKALIPCETITNFQTIDADLVERAPPKTVNAYHCYISFTQWIVDPRDSKRVTVSNESQIVGREACLEAHNSRTIVLLGQRIPFLDNNGTVEHTVANIDPHDIEAENRDSTTRGYHYERTYQITLSRKQGDIDFKRDMVKFGSIACDFSEFKCKDPNLMGELYWKSERGGETTTLYRGVVQLVKRDETEASPELTYAVINENGKVFVLETLRNETNDGMIEFQTEIDNVYVIQQTRPPFRRFQHELRWEEKLQNIYSEATGFEVVDAVDVVKRLCRKEKTDLQRSFDSSGFTGVSLPRKGCKGLKMMFDPEFVVERCLRVNVSLRETTECYQEIPVRYDGGNDWFLDPFSRIVSFTQHRIKCHREFHQNETEMDSQSTPKEVYQYPKYIAPPASAQSHGDTSTKTVLIYIGCLLLLVWLSAIVLRVVKKIVNCTCGRSGLQGQDNQPDPMEDLFTLREFVELVKPPLVGRNHFRTTQTVQKLPEPNVKVTF